MARRVVSGAIALRGGRGLAPATLQAVEHWRLLHTSRWELGSMRARLRNPTWLGLLLRLRLGLLRLIWYQCVF